MRHGAPPGRQHNSAQRLAAQRAAEERDVEAIDLGPEVGEQRRQQAQQPAQPAPPGAPQMTPEQQLATHLKDENSGTAAAGKPNVRHKTTGAAPARGLPMPGDPAPPAARSAQEQIPLETGTYGSFRGGGMGLRLSAANIARVVAAGVDIVVAGSAIFNTPDPVAATKALKDAAAVAP